MAKHLCAGDEHHAVLLTREGELWQSNSTRHTNPNSVLLTREGELWQSPLGVIVVLVVSC